MPKRWSGQTLSRRRLLIGAGEALGGSVGLLLLGPGNPARSVQPGQSRVFPADPAGSTAVAPDHRFPLKASANGRYLVDQAGMPFRIQGDSAQSLIANLTLAEAETYLSDRQSKGFNTINVNLLEHKFAVHAPANRQGVPPFTTAGDFSTPNEPYFAFADQVIDLAASKQMAVSLAYMYLGYGGGDEGWWADLNAPPNNASVCFEFGRYIGRRYKDRSNVFFVVGGDMLPSPGSEGETRLRRIFDGLRDAGASQLQAGDWDAPCLSTDEPAFAADLGLNAVYTYGPGKNGATYTEARAAFDRSPAIPAYLKETGYEAERWIAGDPASIRKYEYWAILSGATAGGFYGHRDIWGFATDSWWSGFGFGHQRWEQSLDAPGAFDWQRLGALLDGLPWYDLVPSGAAGAKELIVDGRGTWGGDDYVASAATADGAAALAYLPPTAAATRAISVDLSVLKGTVEAQWFDPSTGAYSSIGSIPSSGVKRFVTPGKNGGGAGDWVLRLESTDRPRSLQPGPRIVGVSKDGPRN